MTYELEILFGASLLYLLILFFVAYVTDSGLVPESWINNPFVYVLSLGVYATSWSYYGSVGFAGREGYLFLTVYLGVTLAYLMTPLLLRPILRLTRFYQLTSLADLLAFRYRSQLAGVLVTLFMLIGSLPYIALQIRAITTSLSVLTREVPPQQLALGFCGMLILFAIMFGARSNPAREKHRGLVAAIAFESLMKLTALLVVGLFSLFQVFSGPADLSRWLSNHPEAIEALYAPMREGPWTTLIFLSFCAAFLLPRQFHMMFTENLSLRSISVASWAFPLFLLLLNLAILPILWAGNHLRLEMDTDYYVLGVTLINSPKWLPALAYIGGFSAASAMMIVTTLALSSMCMTHLLLPASYPDPQLDIYRWLLWGRRLLIAIIVMAGFGFYHLIEQNQGLVQLGLISFVAVAQFLPGIIGLLYWPQATRQGFLLGLLAGIGTWVYALLLPLLERSGFIYTGLSLPSLHHSLGMAQWEFATFWSLTLNGLLFVGVSLITRQSPEEREAARACRSDTSMATELKGVVAATNTQQFTEGLAETIGQDTAEQEVQQALTDLGMADDEIRPGELRRLREQIERNLSGLLGPQMAHIIINRQLMMDSESKTALADSIRHIEEQLERSRTQLRGLTADMDKLRRFHRQILLDLPLGACAVTPDQRVVLWNLAMELLSGVPSGRVVGYRLNALPAPWGDLLAGFALAQDRHIPRMEVTLEGRPHWFNLHKATIPDPHLGSGWTDSRTGLVMLLEDMTDLETLEAELAHSDRLASIGRLAAGVAHEIGNPITGIASLAQNLRYEKEPEIIAESINSILQQTKRISNIIGSLMNFSRSGSIGSDYQTFKLKSTIDEAIRLVKLTRSGKQVEYRVSCRKKLQLVGDKQHISQVLVNLLANACDASDPGGKIEIIAFQEDDQVQLEVMDQGRGITERDQQEIFEPFFTTKKPGEGTGLGLSMVYKIIQEHQGQIKIESVPGTGTRVVVRLPQHRDQQQHETDTDH
ncbi:MAG: GHKL domain-containing protein [Gammaproteobacteria bacterium]|nr:GHKL domain-containing protein [Gammaproteobacteria bacterium]